MFSFPTAAAQGDVEMSAMLVLALLERGVLIAPALKRIGVTDQPSGWWRASAATGVFVDRPQLSMIPSPFVHTYCR